MTRSQSQRIPRDPWLLLYQGLQFPGIGLLVSGSDFNADVAQLVERHLAKVKVAGSIPVVRSRNTCYAGVSCVIGRPPKPG